MVSTGSFTPTVLDQATVINHSNTSIERTANLKFSKESTQTSWWEAGGSITAGLEYT